ncbi:MAG: KipI antagonist, partial [Hymenobacter sp.]
MSLHIVRSGLLTTVQDLGRPSYQHLGVVVGGALDVLSLRVANLLVGNPEGAAGLEITLLGPTVRFEANLLIALTGADLSPTLDGQPAPMHRAVAVRAGTVLAFGAARAGCRAYLAVAGSLAVPLVLGSRSTYLRASLGGWHG